MKAYRAFWQDPDWSGGANLRDPGTTPFWCKDPLRNGKPVIRLKLVQGRVAPTNRRCPSCRISDFNGASCVRCGYNRRIKEPS